MATLSLSPTSGQAKGGDTITITASAPFFLANTTVFFGSKPATNITFIDNQHITCVTPPHLPANYTVTVVTNN